MALIQGQAVVYYLHNLATMAFLDIKPGANPLDNSATTNEFVIHNIHFSGAATLYFYDGTNLLSLRVLSSGDSLSFSPGLHANSTYWYRLKNTTAGNIDAGYDGMVTA